ncbi:hypothetical protein OSB04_016453 [Centaurea solstitialis]|uniref:Uncharacterized protein n=1 Tax=Centaurea solstitialis TaxID=347529 RepID=A0AA38T8N8_9ASTR|nr:hypothetical protein OSB04_016453 [Centaurea solstitialis]
MEQYTCWVHHGEDFDKCNYTLDQDCNDTNDHFELDNDSRDNSDEMLHDVEDDIADKDYNKFEQLFIDSEKSFYVGCSKFTKLSAVLKLFNLKANNGWSDKSFTSLLEILHEMLPEDNELPVSLYQAKKLMCLMGLEIERIHACPNDCMLYRNADVDLRECCICGTSRCCGICYVSEPFILAKQASHVFFVEDPKDSKWHIVLHGKRHILRVENVTDEEEYDQFDELPPFCVDVPSTNVPIDETS